ncbi:hypothetical protein [Levilactobacillus andaensis]|uniref:hypothetical protein n=1 Tax=Levilactobacillus andaensis TaxID=2799570 RepID=UPI001944CB3D|nr:hypothetical protein [Levilactobacillus andaensis]
MDILEKVQQLQHQIQHFQEMDKKQMSQQELLKAIMEAMTINGQYELPEKIVRYGPNINLYRARKLQSSNMNTLLKWTEQDYWEVPSEFVSNFGRLNEPHESIFYASLDFSQTLNEIRAADGEFVAISRYNITQEFPSVVISNMSRYIRR